MSKAIRGGLITVIIIIAGIVGFAWHQQQKAARFVQSNTPTLFFHGGGSSYHAEEHMVNAAKKAGVTKTVIRANVDKNGDVTLRGAMHKNSINPIVEVNYEDNRQLNFVKHGVWATNVVKALQKQYGIQNMNMVGHSLGNISIIYYMLDNAQNKSMPKLRKQVDMAGHFDGLNFASLPNDIREPQGLKLGKNGKPNQMNQTYQQMTQLRTTYPQNQVRVLNIIGNIGGQTDGTVSNASSLSLKYLVADRAKSYQVKIFHGKLARHSKLHSNPAVDKVLINFLWRK
ncbi:alpha/beta hydrolase [uncultured Limosilactobacillus sp.]|uniref:alpha/beta hydrolase n=1 Tax=uncultured Limosilactobacillus sp. TaxID=2837629 RepID=UPI0025E67EB2|nr:alpha/beta hydrolase [uncultured Limosilactobacillus sp.]